MTLDGGATRWDGNPAPARRVHLPFAAAETSQLTADGETLMRRALEWVANITPPPLQQLLFVVPSPGSLGPTDTAKQALFESWGYTVNQIDDDAPLADYQAAIGANSVAYVAATAVAASFWPTPQDWDIEYRTGRSLGPGMSEEIALGPR